ncbi:MAG: phosphatidylglycerophosphatase A [Desulfovibrio sp.]
MNTQKWATHLATLGPVGLLPFAPGTYGSLVAALAAPFCFMPLPMWARIVVLALVLVVGTWAASHAEKELGQKDPGSVIIDEVLGQWITFLPFAALNWWQILAGFVLFRAFDILKPAPVKQAETAFAGGLGVMIDDGVAGLYAMGGLWLVTLI